MMDIKYFICDVDGCLNDGKIYWSEQGKLFKAFGSHDHDGLRLLSPHVKIKFITADKSGWNLTYKRIVEHMNFELELVKEVDRFRYVEEHDFDHVAYMGDGLYDAPIIAESKIGIAPYQARIEARLSAQYITPNKGSEGAVCDACLYIMKCMGINYAV
jgi:3-deoxy-D-manno-octulosonate 8-phosphate phosphatase (KDO 8-P phosphatase)